MQFLELNNNFEYFIHVGGVLKQGVEGAAASLTNKYILIFD